MNSNSSYEYSVNNEFKRLEIQSSLESKYDIKIINELLFKNNCNMKVYQLDISENDAQ